MKIKLDIDCTPEEARQFFGLPDVKPLQDELLADLAERMKAGMQSMDPEVLWRTWMPQSTAGLDAMRQFWAQFSNRDEQD